MARPRSEKPLRKVTLNLHEEDIDYLCAAYPHTSYQLVVRSIIHKACKRLRENESRVELPDAGTSD